MTLRALAMLVLGLLSLPPVAAVAEPVRVFSSLGRTPNPNHALRRQVRPEALLRALVSVMGGTELATLPRPVRAALSKAAGKPVQALSRAKTQQALLASLRRSLGDESFAQVVGRQAGGAKRAAQQLDHGWAPPDASDMQRGWGFQLLPKNDRAFRDPGFLTAMLQESDQTGDGMVHHSPSSPAERFRQAWSLVAPKNTQPISFTLTGSDANNLLYSVALKAARMRLGDHGSKGQKVNHAEILYLDGVYGAGRGRMGGVSFLPYGKDGAPNLDEYKITSPHSYTFKPTDPAEIARLEQKEAKALAEIEQKVQSSTVPIGGLLMEPILGAKGVMFFRPEFLSKLRALCDRLKVPIFADEILTGGGRTGKFFAYEHYQGFEPDFVTFGKGLQVAGIACVARQRTSPGDPYPPGYDGPDTMTTLAASSESLLKSTQVMTRIRDGKLMENAARVGSYLLKKLQARDRPEQGAQNPDQDPDYGRAPGPSRGLGLLLYTPNHGLPVIDAHGRLMPYLTLSKGEVDRLFSKSPAKRY